MKPRLLVVSLLIAGGLAVSASAVAQELRQFVPGSYSRIVQARAGKPFVLAMWSLTCEPCRDELELFSKLLEKYPKFDLVLVSTDTPADFKVLRDVLVRNRIKRAETWVFADDYVEKLRFEIDRQWRGELPRTYFFGSNGSVRALSGKLDAAAPEAWLNAK